MDFKGEFELGLLDNRHVLIQLQQQVDYLRLYSRPVWYVKGFPMRIFKWTSSFHVDRESPIVPIWLSLPRLPIHFFKKEALFSIASAIGPPLRLDSLTQTLKRPSLARVQIKIDLLKERPERMWIGCEEGDGFWQELNYEDVPDYCQHCWHVGHSEAKCHVNNPELKMAANQDLRKLAKGKQPQLQTSLPKNHITIGTKICPEPSIPSSSAIAHLEISAEPINKKDVATDVGKRTELSKIAATEGLKVVVPVVEIVASPVSLSSGLVVLSKKNRD